MEDLKIDKLDLHVGRSWSGHPLEDNCPCAQKECGLVQLGENQDCPEHGMVAAKTIRQSHYASSCPGASK